MKNINTGDNKKLHQIFIEDQNDREQKIWSKHQELVSKRDAKRLRKVKTMLLNEQLKTAGDMFKAAVIFHHNYDLKNFEVANHLAQQAKILDSSDYDAIWLAAVSLDRLLVAQGKKQKFGSQFEYVEIEKGKYRYQMAPYDMRTSDRTRALNELPSLKKLRSMEGGFLETK